MADIGIIKFQLGGIQFGIHADHILEIVRFSGARKIPRPLPYVVGLTEHRKYLVTVVDFRKRLGLTPFDLVPGITMIITKISSGMIGLLVESLSHFKRISETHILPPLSIAGFPEYLLHGVLTEEGNEILLLPNLEKIFSSYMRITLLPITAAEKIAFQYRFTPGSLTRTLESTLAMQGYLEQTLVNKLPRSMSLPSVFVHKITSYYPDFIPKETQQEQAEWGRALTQTFKAGDETYLSLSQKLSDQRTDRETEVMNEHVQEMQDFDTFLQAEIGASLDRCLERLLHYAMHVNKDREQQQGVLRKMLISDAYFGKHLADTLHISRTRLTSYLSYYLPVELPRQRETLHQASDRIPSDAKGHAVLAENRLQELCSTLTRVDQVLQILHEEHTQITRQQMRYLANQYQVSLVKIAKLLTLFPGLIYLPEPEDQEHGSEAGCEHSTLEPTEQIQEDRQQDVLTQLHAISYHFSGSSVSSWVQFLDAKHVLTENQAVRYAAAQLGVPTCRLSKFRSYYQLRIDN
ncbi:purine-binding chemotaxis protein chew [Candidatus Vecturithrix granuli]|uniref:Purine-binding chemotaxis protein chew n=1 Tax=Vecturithrix granuli TaxID=1499967 RepID=A0A081C8X9_VECG1|nr:purine-binding chemotaxis protein chew [Candidatus Vecturithrix granuli]